MFLRSEARIAVQLNHTIVHAYDKHTTAAFYAELLGLAPAKPFAHFLVLELSNGVSLDFIDDDRGPIDPRHFAFLVSDAEFDQIFARIRAKNLPYWADPARQLPNQTNSHFGGRGLYWQDPNAHLLEIITRPYEIDRG